ncbi:hypothetical protein GLAREA_00207 [Glarea lozoyensis ATCC 20868]|uniref:Uncharacterized protein n=1 Tax=Glarea lozoyensis (strain ATCC 20868 / MF5171) TaxID=1116229 RepID=S3CVS4_GLAL2|nr:uncharacterized protein GLAREA_00207 [Glarea lozoyensis ATCC 20868]EPE29049.1 hypothetical protein GLAREA_00207 [Glarea lozoyensis ATCC 20868]
MFVFADLRIVERAGTMNEDVTRLSKERVGRRSLPVGLRRHSYGTNVSQEETCGGGGRLFWLSILRKREGGQRMDVDEKQAQGTREGVDSLEDWLKIGQKVSKVTGTDRHRQGAGACSSKPWKRGPDADRGDGMEAGGSQWERQTAWAPGGPEEIQEKSGGRASLALH